MRVARNTHSERVYSQVANSGKKTLNGISELTGADTEVAEAVLVIVAVEVAVDNGVRVDWGTGVGVEESCVGSGVSVNCMVGVSSGRVVGVWVNVAVDLFNGHGVSVGVGVGVGDWVGSGVGVVGSTPTEPCSEYPISNEFPTCVIGIPRSTIQETSFPESIAGLFDFKVKSFWPIFMNLGFAILEDECISFPNSWTNGSPFELQ